MNIPWTPPERHWRDTLLDALIPAVDGAAVPGIAALDLDAFWRRYQKTAPPLLQLGFRGAVWGLTWGPAFVPGVWRPLHWLAPEERERVLTEANTSRFYFARQLVMMLKTVASLAYFHAPAARAAQEPRP